MRKHDSGRVVWWLVTLLAILLIFAAFAWTFRIAPSIRVGTAVVSQTLCGGVFVSGLPVDRVFAEEVKVNPGLKILVRRLHTDVDTLHKTVVTTWAGHFASVATYTPTYGCLLGEPDSQPVPASSPIVTTPIPASATPPEKISDDSLAVIPPANPKLAAALDAAFAESRPGAHRQVRAVVVMRDGKIIAERYAPGISPETPLLAYSVSKSVINALIGILVGDGKLDVNARAPVASLGRNRRPPPRHHSRRIDAHDLRPHPR